MEIDITQIVVTVIGLMTVIVTSVIVPLIKSKLTQSQWDSIVNYAIAGVQAAEIIFNAQGTGKEKFEYVKSYIEKQCTDKGIEVDADTIQIAIENAWKALGFDKH